MALTLNVTLADGTSHEITPRNPDFVRWDHYAHRNGIKAATEAPMLWQTFLAYAAMRRTGLVPADTSFDRFADDLCMDLMPQVDEEDKPVDPIQPVRARD